MIVELAVLAVLVLATMIMMRVYNMLVRAGPASSRRGSTSTSN
jgi:hypothetical protein